LHGRKIFPLCRRKEGYLTLKQRKKNQRPITGTGRGKRSVELAEKGGLVPFIVPPEKKKEEKNRGPQRKIAPCLKGRTPNSAKERVTHVSGGEKRFTAAGKR